MKKIIFILIFISTVTSISNAEFRDETIVTDRPDFTEASETIDAGHYQIEAGYTFFNNDDDGQSSREHTLPEILTRIGLDDNTELRLLFTGYERSDAAGLRFEGVSDFGIGFKHRVSEQDGYLPDFSLIGELFIPTSEDSDELSTVFKFIWSYDLDRFYLAGNINLSALEGEEERFLEYANSVTFGFGLSDSVGTYIEYFGLYPVDDVVEPSQSLVNGGFTYLVNNDLQLDIRAGFGLNSAAVDSFYGLGFSYRR